MIECDTWLRSLPPLKTTAKAKTDRRMIPVYRVEVDGQQATVALKPLAGLLKLLAGKSVTAQITSAGLNITYQRMALTLFDLSAAQNQ